ncbi:MAG: recombinase family protein [Vicinamibacterales bacterium]
MRAAIYARVSKDHDKNKREEHADTESVKRQVEGGRAFIEKQGWTLDEAQVYRDNGVSGALFEGRAAFQRMMSDARAGAFDALVFFDLDRFTRLAHKGMDALSELADLGVSVWDFSNGQQVDLDSLEGEMSLSMRLQLVQFSRREKRKHSTGASHAYARDGYWVGGAPFGYEIVGPKKQKTLKPKPDEEAVVVEIYTRAANGEGYRSIAEALNLRKVPAPRAQLGRPSGWSMMTVMDILKREVYRGVMVFGKTKKAWGRELGKRQFRPDGTKREKGQIPVPPDQWTRVEKPEWQIVEPDLAERVATIRGEKRERYFASVAKGGRVPERAHGKFLLSGGMLVCSECGANFEARVAPWKGLSNVYICSTRRRKPGVCSSTLALPIVETDNAVLQEVIDEALGTRYVDELLMMVETVPDETGRLTSDRDRLRKELNNLGEVVAQLGSGDGLVPKIKERQAELAKVEAALRRPRPERPNADKVRAALLQRAGEWRETLRAEPKVARLVLRRMLGPLTLSGAERPPFEKWDADVKPGTTGVSIDITTSGWFVKWDADVKPGILAGILPTDLLASPTGFEPVF